MSQIMPLLNKLTAAIAVGDRAQVNAAAGHLLESNERLGRRWLSVASALQANGEHLAALYAIERWQEEEPREPAARFEEATYRASASQPRAALDILDTLSPAFPSGGANGYLKGVLATVLGDRDRAAQEFRRSLASNPLSGQAWLGLASTGNLSAADERAIRAMEAQFSYRPNDAEKAQYYSALGTIEDGDLHHAEAFASFARVAAILYPVRDFDRSVDDHITADAIAQWKSADFATPRRSHGESPDRPIFVTGLPRSGTTLVEQILSSHSQVDGGEELNLFRLIGGDVGGLERGDWNRFVSAGGNASDLRDFYHHLLEQRFPGSGRVVDKTLSASRFMGIQASIFPDAPIIWMRRDPIDCAWSVFRTYFSRGVHWSWSLEGIAEYFHNEDRLFEHWTRELGDRILVVPYAQLVDEPAAWIEQITRHAGLELEPAQLTPHLSSRPVTTASAAQVREPINRKGIGSSAPYLGAMAPFIERYMALTTARKIS